MFLYELRIRAALERKHKEHQDFVQFVKNRTKKHHKPELQFNISYIKSQPSRIIEFLHNRRFYHNKNKNN